MSRFLCNTTDLPVNMIHYKAKQASNAPSPQAPLEQQHPYLCVCTLQDGRVGLAVVVIVLVHVPLAGCAAEARGGRAARTSAGLPRCTLYGLCWTKPC